MDMAILYRIVMMIVLAVVNLLFIIPCQQSRAVEPLVHYAFDEGSGGVLHDKSGGGHDGTIKGGATWVTDLPFGALSFNGTDAFVEGPSDIALTDTGTIEVWCYPRVFGGGLVSWHYNHADAPRPLSLYFDIYSYNRLLGVISDWKADSEDVGVDDVLHWNPKWNQAQSQIVEGDLLPGQVTNRWSHIVMTFDRDNVYLYRNGESEGSKPSFVSPNVMGVPMRIGQGYPQGLPFFDGMIAEVKVYDVALSQDEVKANFTEKQAVFQPHMPRLLPIVTRLDAKGGKLAVEADLVDLSLPEGTIEAQLLSGSNVVSKGDVAITGKEPTASVALSTADLAAGDYEVRCTIRDASGASLAETSRRWRLPKLAAPGVRVKNNLVADLLEVEGVQASAQDEMNFINPRKGWVFISCEADVQENDSIRIEVVGSTASNGAIELKKGGKASGETMLMVPEGPAKLAIRAQGSPVIRKLIVRSVPELMFCGYPGVPKIEGFGDYDRAFLQDEVLPNVNAIVSNWNGATFKSYADRRLEQWPEDRLNRFNMLEYWHGLGRKWLEEQNIPSLNPEVSKFNWKTNPITPQQAFDWWAVSYGFTDPQWSGLVADEFGLGADGPTDTWPHRDPRYRTAPYTEAIERMATDPKFKGKELYIWCGALDRTGKRDQRFVEAARSAGYKLAIEEYMSEQANEEAAIDLLQHHVRNEIERADAVFPGLVEDLILVPGFYSAPPESCNVDPNVDFKVWMDVQMHYMATSPEFFGLGGIMWYKTYYADEESIRWMGRLYRHYAIEGNTEMLSPKYGFTYELNHLKNPDFDEQLDGWTVKEAQAGAVKTGSLGALGRQQGRMYEYHKGNSFLLTQRSSSGPNQVSQVIQGLVPGKIYTAKMVVGDHPAVTKMILEDASPNARLSVDGVENMPDRSIVSVVGSAVGSASFQFHRLMFRATAPTATLTISDWAADDAPGGPAGQELMINFIEVQPYFE